MFFDFLTLALSHTLFVSLTRIFHNVRINQRLLELTRTIVCQVKYEWITINRDDYQSDQNAVGFMNKRLERKIFAAIL